MIHKYKQLGFNIVLDIYSGAVHVVDDVVYDMLEYILEPFMPENQCQQFIADAMADKYTSEEIAQAYSDI